MSIQGQEVRDEGWQKKSKTGNIIDVEKIWSVDKR